MKYVQKTTSPMLYGSRLQLGIQRLYAVLPMPWVSSALASVGLDCPLMFEMVGDQHSLFCLSIHRAHPAPLHPR